MAVKVAGWVLVGIVAGMAVLTVAPGLIGLSQVSPVAQLIAMRGWLMISLSAFGVFLLGVGFLARHTKGKARRTLVLGLAVLLAGLGHGGVLLARGVDPGESFAARPDTAIDVLTLNTYGMSGGIGPAVELIEATAADVVALQEITVAAAEQIGSTVRGDYQVFTHATGPDAVQGTALLVAERLGRYRQVAGPEMTFGAVRATPQESGRPELLSLHPHAPVPRAMPIWRAELGQVAELCRSVDGLVLAGDLNATLDHQPLRTAACADGSAHAWGSGGFGSGGFGSGGLGTWPKAWPALWGAPIDHVLIDPEFWRAVDSRVIDTGRFGDHRAVMVRIVPVHQPGK